MVFSSQKKGAVGLSLGNKMLWDFYQKGIAMKNRIKCIIFAAAFALLIASFLSQSQFQAIQACFLSAPQEDPTEPNDDFEQARQVTLDSSFNVMISPQGDRDFCKCVVEEQGYLKNQKIPGQESFPAPPQSMTRRGRTSASGKCLSVPSPLLNLPGSERSLRARHIFRYRQAGMMLLP